MTAILWRIAGLAVVAGLLYKDSGALRATIAANSHQVAGLTAEAATYNLLGARTWGDTVRLRAPSQTATDCLPLPRPADPRELFFVRLRLRERGSVVSENFYWSAGKGSPCTDLNRLPAAATTTLVATDSGKLRLLVVPSPNWPFPL